MPTVDARYQDLVSRGEIEHDPAQGAVAAKLAALETELREHRLARKSSALGWLFAARQRRAEPIKGLYIFGEVGRGKTMLMDIFVARSAVQRKRRAHFHEFMADVHERIHLYRQKLKRGEVKGDDPIPPVAAAIADEAWLLCFDEFQVTDIADAMLLGRLFSRLFELGVVVVATSNVAPQDLYAGGLNRALFLPFIALLQEHMSVVELKARTDFRLEKLEHMPVWHVASHDGAHAALLAAWRTLTGGDAGAAHDIPVKGRIIRVDKAARGTAWFTFAELCQRPLGAADYIKIAHEFHTLIIEDIPVMGIEGRNEARRFIALIDTLYDHAVKVVASAEADPDGLYTATDGIEAQEFKRTASRLTEMRTKSYLALPHGKRQDTDPLLERIAQT